MREKLIDIVLQTPCVAVSSRTAAGHIADWLIANGVTVQKWIPVTERLPEDLPENEGKKVIPCLVSLKSAYPNGKPNTQKRQRQLQYYGSQGWKWEWSRIGACRVTHWMPLPEPPKEG